MRATDPGRINWRDETIKWPRTESSQWGSGSGTDMRGGGEGGHSPPKRPIGGGGEIGVRPPIISARSAEKGNLAAPRRKFSDILAISPPQSFQPYPSLVWISGGSIWGSGDIPLEKSLLLSTLPGTSTSLGKSLVRISDN